MQDWAEIEVLARGFTLSQRDELFALASVFDACVALECDEEVLVAGLRGPRRPGG